MMMMQGRRRRRTTEEDGKSKEEVGRSAKNVGETRKTTRTITTTRTFGEGIKAGRIAFADGTAFVPGPPAAAGGKDGKVAAAAASEDAAEDSSSAAKDGNHDTKKLSFVKKDDVGNSVSSAAAPAENSGGDGSKFPAVCNVCNDPGDLFCCDACPCGYHSSCHAPKIREIPEGDWLCMACNPKLNGGGDGAVGKKPDLFAILPPGYDISDAAREGSKDDNIDSAGQKKKEVSSRSERKRARDSRRKKNESKSNDQVGDQQEAKTVKVTIKEPTAKCSVCSKMGEEDAVLCRACDKYYHLECHDPPLDSKPKGRWRCNACKTANVKIPVELLASIPTEHSDFDISGKTLKVCVKGPEANCSECNEKGGETIWCRACDTSFHLQCHDPPLQSKPRGRWRCGKCKKSNTPAPKPRNKIKRETLLVNLKLFEGEHDDDCYICFNGGDLVCCDFCSKAFHMKCHIPPLPFIPDGIWKCCECSAVERKKKSRCGECKACTRDDCGKCTHCKDKPKFGGRGTTRKPCIKKICPYPRFAPPASATTVAGLITKLPSSSSPAPPSKSDRKKRSRDSVDGSNTRSKKRARFEDDVKKEAEEIEVEEESEDEFGGGPIVVKVKISSLRSAYMDSESIKIRKHINSARRDPKNSKAQDKACEFLRKYMTSPEAIKKMILFGGVEMICNAMKDHPDKSIVQAEACCTLAEMIWVDPTISTKLAHEGAINLIATCMDRFGNNVKVQQMGCGVFRALSYDE